MRATRKIAGAVLVAPFVVLGSGAAGAGDSFPSPVTSCDDVRAYIGADNSMTMDTFKKLLIASGLNLNGQGEQALNNQCKATAYTKEVIMSQHVLTKADGSEIRATTQVIEDNGVCRLINVSLAGC
jgi:hypothetical protein